MQEEQSWSARAQSCTRVSPQGVVKKEQVLSGALGASIRKLVKEGIVNPERELGGTQEEEDELRQDEGVGRREKARKEPDTLMSS